MKELLAYCITLYGVIYKNGRKGLCKAKIFFLFMSVLIILQYVNILFQGQNEQSFSFVIFFCV